jgi:mono/diheme cytochrome c family protein
MAEIGRRFELAGRAANAKRFELAAFEIGELEEAFDEDLPLAEYPKEGPTEALPTLAENFRKTNLPALKKALDAKDAAAFGVAFEQAATACNGCHTASQHAFLEIPTKPGGEVPKITP